MGRRTELPTRLRLRGEGARRGALHGRRCRKFVLARSLDEDVWITLLCGVGMALAAWYL